LPTATFHAAFCGISQKRRFYFTLPRATFHRASYALYITPAKQENPGISKKSSFFEFFPS